MNHVYYTRADIPVSTLLSFVADPYKGAQVIFAYEPPTLRVPLALECYEVTPAGMWVHQWHHEQVERFGTP